MYNSRLKVEKWKRSQKLGSQVQMSFLLGKCDAIIEIQLILVGHLRGWGSWTAQKWAYELDNKRAQTHACWQHGFDLQYFMVHQELCWESSLGYRPLKTRHTHPLLKARFIWNLHGKGDDASGKTRSDFRTYVIFRTEKGGRGKFSDPEDRIQT